MQARRATASFDRGSQYTNEPWLDKLKQGSTEPGAPQSTRANGKTRQREMPTRLATTNGLKSARGLATTTRRRKILSTAQKAAKCWKGP